jgi:hypothetical protein
MSSAALMPIHIKKSLYTSMAAPHLPGLTAIKDLQNAESHEWDCHESPNSLRIGPAGAKGGELFSEYGLHCFYL